jgi:hypothetical protein
VKLGLGAPREPRKTRRHHIERRNAFADTMQTQGFRGEGCRRLKWLILLVPQTGLEPVTPSLRMTCSTN